MIKKYKIRLYLSVFKFDNQNDLAIFEPRFNSPRQDRGGSESRWKLVFDFFGPRILLSLERNLVAKHSHLPSKVIDLGIF